MKISAFQETTQRFRNAAAVHVREVNVDSPAVAAVLDASRNLFSCLDRNDSYQAALIRHLWELRSSVQFSLLSFDNDEIGLADRSLKLTEGLSQIPAANEGTKALVDSINKLLVRPENPKYIWLKTILKNDAKTDQSAFTGFLVMMAMGRTFGWPKDRAGNIDLSVKGQVIDSLKDFSGVVFDRIVIPGTCQYMSSRLYYEVFCLGRTNMIDVLLYPGERFTLRERLSPPGGPIFNGRLTSSRFVTQKEVFTDISDDLGGSDADEQISQSLWEMAHDGQRTKIPGYKIARYIICMDGRGMFVPEDTQILVWREEYENADVVLESIAAEQLVEGDWIVIRPTDTGKLLDLLSAEEGFGQKLEEICDWRPALDALMLTESPEQIAQEMLDNGAHGVSLPQCIRNWADGSVYGPGARNELSVLLAILIRDAKLPEPENFEQYVSDHWAGLQELRGIRHRAGINVRNELQQQLTNALKEHVHQIKGQLLRLENGVNVQIVQIAAVDSRISWVPPSILSHLQTMRGGRWQG